MTITVYITPDIEKQVQENISLGDTDAVRRLLVEALEPTVDALMNNKPQLSVEEFEIMLDRLAEKFMEYVGPDVSTIVRLRVEPRRDIRRPFIIMIYLADTNILLRIAHRSDVLFPIVRASVHELWAKGHRLQTTLQNCAEFWNVSTRPINQNGLGLTLAETDDLLSELELAFPLLPDLPNVYAKWRELVMDYGVSGVQVHDARLVATMIVHGVTHILTFNTSDFVRYAPQGIVVVDPATV